MWRTNKGKHHEQDTNNGNVLFVNIRDIIRDMLFVIGSGRDYGLEGCFCGAGKGDVGQVRPVRSDVCGFSGDCSRRMAGCGYSEKGSREDSNFSEN